MVVLTTARRVTKTAKRALEVVVITVTLVGLIMPAAITSKTAKKILVLLLITDYTEESEKDSEEDLGKLAVHASSCAKKNG